MLGVRIACFGKMRTACPALESHTADRSPGEHGAALVAVLVIIVLLTVLGAAMVSLALTEVTIAFAQADAAAAQALADAGAARAAYELSVDPAWPGGTGSLGGGQYQVTVAGGGTVAVIDAVGTQGGGRRRVATAVVVLPPFLAYAVLANTTATLGGPAPGLVVRNGLPSADAGAAHASNRLGAATALTVSTATATVAGGLTAQGTIAGVSCATWPWRCSETFGVLPFPRLDVDGAGAGSLQSRARAAVDPVDGLNLYFRGGDRTSRCRSGGAWNFGANETQRCWDKYVNDRGGVLGAGMAGAVFYVEFNPNENTSYRQPIGGPPGPRTVDCIGWESATETLCLRARPAQARGSCAPPALPCGNIEYPQSALRQVTGTIVVFRRGAGTTVVGDAVLENPALRTTDYLHASWGPDPALLAAGRLLLASSGAAASARTVILRGVVYTLAGQDNPDAAGQLQGSASSGIAIQHGADQVAVVILGVLMSNGSITVQDTAANGGTVAVEFDPAALDALPGPFASATPARVVIPLSWSSGD